MARDERRISIDQLFHGISRQPTTRRKPGQVEDAVNVILSPIDGISKRPGTQWVAQIDAGRVSFTGASWTASTKTITKTGAFTGYTHAAGDYVYIRLSGADIRWGLYGIASKTSNDAIVLTESIADEDQADNVTSGWNTAANYRMHLIDRDEVEQYVVLYGDGQIRMFDPQGGEQIVRITDSALQYLFGHGLDGESLGEGADAENMVLTTSDDYTLVANRGVTMIARATNDYAFVEKDSVQDMLDGVAGYTDGDRFYAQAAGRGLPSGFYRFDSGGTTFAKLFCRRFGPDWSSPQKYNGITAHSFGIDFIEADGTEWKVRIDPLNIVAAASMTDVANQFEAAINTALQALTSGSEECTVTYEAESDNRSRFIITSPFDGAGAAIRGIFAYGNGDDHWAARRPFSATRAEDGRGDSGGSLTLAERFTRIAVPGQLGARPQANTMPHALIRYTLSETADDGTYYPGEWELDNLTWDARMSGSADSNPAPVIFQAAAQAGKDQDGMQVADMAFHLDRLVIAAGEQIVMSQAGELFNFYVDDATNIVDSDPISSSLSTTGVTVCKHITPFRKSLLIDTRNAAQFELDSGGQLLTQATAAITKSTSYDTLPKVRPVAIGDVLYLLSKRADAGVMLEYFYDDTRVSNFANEVTSHVLTLLPTDVRSIAASPGNLMVFVVPTDCQRIYVYFTWWNGNEKIQSSWAVWEFPDFYRIVDVGVLKNDLYLLVESGDAHHLEKLAIQRQVL